jgi:ATP-dependent DNA ligase
MAFTNEILRGKGEGVILRLPRTPYEQGASKLVMKFKVTWLI